MSTDKNSSPTVKPAKRTQSASEPRVPPKRINKIRKRLSLQQRSENYDKSLKSASSLKGAELDEALLLPESLKDDVEHLVKGLRLVKVRSAQKQFPRNFELSQDLMGFKYTDSRKWIKRGVTSYDLADVKEIRSGWKTDVFEFVKKSSNKGDVLEDASFSLIIGAKHETLDLVADSKELRDKCVKVLTALIKKQRYSALRRQHYKWVKNHFLKADVNKDGVLTFDEIINVLNHMNISMSKHDARRIFEEADINKKKNKNEVDALDPEEFVRLYQMLRQRPEIEEILKKYTRDDDVDYLDLEEFQDFLNDAQKLNLSADEVKDLINLHEPLEENKQQSVLSVEGLMAFLLSNEQSIFNPKHATIYHDMRHPLTDYFINSSHNTYLMEDQLRGASSAEAYKRALKSGCRCVELDIWDGPNDEPIIFHGHTLTSKILFKDAIKACRDYAFVASEYPVILSLENHCSVEQQRFVAKHLKSILGSKLWYSDKLEESSKMPSPELLKGKIIVKGKKLPPETPDEEEEVSDEDEAAELEDDMVAEDLKTKVSGTKVKLAKELSDLVVLKSVHFESFEHSRNNHKYFEMSSFVEKKALKLVSMDWAGYVQHNTRNLSRTYPNGLRTDSSNYEPNDLWCAGCQIVALNFQTPDKPMQIYRGKFLDNGGCGYLLKPAILRDSSLQFDPTNPKTYGIMPAKLTIKVISAQRLPKPDKSLKGEVIDPYVTVSVFGVPPDNQKVKTKIIMDNGFNPTWNETFTLKVSMPALAVVRFAVYDYDVKTKNDFIGQYTLPFTSLQEGFRHIHLKDKDGEVLPLATVFVHISLDS